MRDRGRGSGARRRTASPGGRLGGASPAALSAPRFSCHPARAHAPPSNHRKMGQRLPTSGWPREAPQVYISGRGGAHFRLLSQSGPTRGSRIPSPGAKRPAKTPTGAGDSAVRCEQRLPQSLVASPGSCPPLMPTRSQSCCPGAVVRQAGRTSLNPCLPVGAAEGTSGF